MKTLCLGEAAWPLRSGERGKCRATKTNKSNRYDKTENIRATGRRRLCRPHRPAHFP
jgi:hypothetical protein